MKQLQLNFRAAAGMLLIGLLVLVSISSGCNLGITEEKTGSLLVTIGSAARSFDSNLDEEITAYDITLTHGKTDEQLSGEFAKGDAIEFDELTLGTWRVEAEGKNAAGEVTAAGWTEVDIVPNTRTGASIILSRLEGDGILNVTISWADGVFLQDPTVSLKLYDDFAMTSVLHTLTPSLIDEDEDGTSEGARASQSVPAGSYILSLSIEEADTECSVGRFDVVHILASETASTDAAYTVSVPTGTAGIVIVDPAEHKEIVLSTELLTSAPEVPLLFSVDDTTADAYIWGINGTVVPGETGPTLEYTFTETGSYVVSCLASFGSGAGEGTGAGAEIASDSLKIDIGAFDPRSSADYYAEAKALLDAAVAGTESVVNLNEAYSRLNQALALNPDNADAALALSIMDLAGMLIEEDVVQLMRDGLGMSTYPDTYTEFYANLYSAASLPALYPTQSSLTANGFNDLWANYGNGEDNFYLPLLSGLTNYSYEDGADAYLLQMLSNMDAAGKDLDDLFNGILQALGNSLDSVTGNLEGLSESGRFAVTGDTFLADAFGFDGAFYYSRTEAKLMAAMLYQVQSFAYLMKAVDLGFDISALLDNTSYNTGTGELTVETGYTPFLNNFLQADDDAAAVLADAEAAMLTALELMQEALAELAGRTADEDPAPEDALFLSPYNPLFSDQWSIVEDQLAFVGKYLEEVERSITSGTYYTAVLPVDGDNFNSADFFTWYVQNDFENWPSAPDLGGLTSLPTAIGFSFGALFDPETTLLAQLLELDADGDPTLYTYDQQTSPEPAAGGYDPTQFYYVRMPDITLNRFLSVPLNSDLIDQLNEWTKADGIPFEDTYMYFEENGDGSISVYLSANMLSYLFIQPQGGSDGEREPFTYPIAYHMMEPAGTQTVALPIRVAFDSVQDLSHHNRKHIFFNRS